MQSDDDISDFLARAQSDLEDARLEKANSNKKLSRLIVGSGIAAMVIGGAMQAAVLAIPGFLAVFMQSIWKELLNKDPKLPDGFLQALNRHGSERTQSLYEWAQTQRVATCVPMIEAIRQERLRLRTQKR